ncbi:unnamed protein product [Hermetia illucens]|uniref:Ig-like domain-containing protein n=1 Tax=Hermetia illucens TaxID=343691 RepID=A0A7R8UR96_HERIL|nr:unnamed protein product [Hermetia illucens]
MILELFEFEDGQSDVEVRLIVRKYVEKGSSVTIHCEHNVKNEVLYKVSWFKNEAKFYEFVNGRIPPFRNFSIDGAEIDFSNSNEEQVTLKGLDFDAAGVYFCEVSTNTPIFTKASQEEQLYVILPQTGPPRISFNKRHFFVGERLIANCTTSKARPAPHITWLINGKKVDEKYVRTLHPYAAGGKNSHRSKSHQPSHQQQSPNSPPIDLVDANKGLRSSSSSRKDEVGYGHGYSGQHESHHHDGGGYNLYGQIEPSYESNFKYFDNKYLEGRKHRNSFTREYRRYVNDASSGNNMGSGVSSIGSANVGAVGSGVSSGSLGMNSSPSAPGGRESVPRPHRLSSSQLSIQLTEQHVGNNGRLEITCLATIPAHVGVGEQFADYKTYSIKIDIEKPESSSLPPMSGMAALGNTSSAHRILTRLCLPTALLLFILNQF